PSIGIFFQDARSSEAFSGSSMPATPTAPLTPRGRLVTQSSGKSASDGVHAASLRLSPGASPGAKFGRSRTFRQTTGSREGPPPQHVQQ
ncbi:unnamed protein product, partial [Polarella glacialis]